MCVEPAASMRGAGTALAEQLTSWSESVWRREFARARLKHLPLADGLTIEAMCDRIARQVLVRVTDSLPRADGPPERVVVARDLFGLAED